MTLDEVRKLLTEMSEEMDGSVDKVVYAAETAQNRIYRALQQRIFDFEISDGRFIANQDYAKRFAIIQREINGIINSLYKPSITEYLNTYKTVDETTAYLHKSYNELVIEKSVFNAAKRSIYDQAEYYLLDGLADAYVQPAKYILMQAVANGVTLKQAESLLRNWNDGEMKAGSSISSSRPSPRLQAYAGQIARDSIFQYNGAIQDRIGQQYGLTEFIYVGGLVKDSREFCIHLVKQRRKISLDEIPELVKKYPKGLIPNTTKENFPVKRGGFGCLHTVMMVR
jgi:hypothetical protein